MHAASRARDLEEQDILARDKSRGDKLMAMV